MNIAIRNHQSSKELAALQNTSRSIYVKFREGGIVFKLVVSTNLKNMLVKLDHFPK